MGKVLDMVSSGTQFLSICGPVKLKKQVICFQSAVVG